jgi:hypothetical protein
MRRRVMFSLPLIEQAKMIANRCILAQRPGGVEIFFGFIDLAKLKVSPTKRVPVTRSVTA